MRFSNKLPVRKSSSESSASMAEAPRNLICSRQIAEVLVQLPVLHEVLALVVQEEPVCIAPRTTLQFVRKFIVGQRFCVTVFTISSLVRLGAACFLSNTTTMKATGLRELRLTPWGVQNSSRLSAPRKPLRR